MAGPSVRRAIAFALCAAWAFGPARAQESSPFPSIAPRSSASPLSVPVAPAPEPAAPAGDAKPEAPRLALSMEEVRAIADVREKARAGDSASAAAAADRYLNKFPAGLYRDEALLALGDARAAQGRPERALDAYRRLIEEFPESAFREFAMAQSYAALRQSGAKEEADARLRELGEQYPGGLTRERARFWEARKLADGGDSAALIAGLEKVDREQLPTPQDKAEYDRLLGVALFQTGQRDRAQPHLEHYLQSDDGAEHKAPVLMMLGDEARQARRFEEALGRYQLVAQRYPHPPLLAAAQYWRAEMFVRARVDPAPQENKAELRKQAIRHYSAYLDGSDAEYRARALRRRAELLADAGRNKEALEDYERLFALEPAYRNEPQVISNRAAVLMKLGREKEAMALLDQAGANPEIASGARSALLIEQARLQYEREDCGEVLRLLRPLPPLESSDQVNQALFVRGFCHHRLSQWEEASADLEVLVRYPGYVETVWEPLVESYERSGQYSRMVRFLEEQTASKRIPPSALTYDRMARGYERLNQPALVITAYAEAQKIDPNALSTPDALVRLGKAEEATGRRDLAITHYESALAAPAATAATPTDTATGEAHRTALERLAGLFARSGEFERLVTQIEAARPKFSAPADAAALQRIQRSAYLDWGRADSAAGRYAEAAQHLQAAWTLTPADDTAQRLETLALLAAAHRANGQPEQGVATYQGELEQSEDGLYRVQLTTALAEFYLASAEAMERERGLAEALPLYESALLHLPDQQWERRYRIVEKLDPVYQDNGNYGRLIGYLESMENAVTDRQFRLELRKYRMELYRVWGERLVSEDRPDEAAEQLGKALTLILAQANWSGLPELASARGAALRADRPFEAQIRQIRDAEPRAADTLAAKDARLAIVATRITWGAFREREQDPEGALAQYAAARERITEADWAWRLDATSRMAAVHGRRGDRAKQTEMLETLLAQAPPGAEQDAVRLAAVEANLAWARELDQAKKPEESLPRYRRAAELTDGAPWRVRYPVVQEFGTVLLREHQSRELAGLYEALRPQVDDPALAEQIDLFLAQLYVKWADDTARAKKFEHARLRYHKALDYAPHAQWELRVAIAKQLEGIYAQENDRQAVLKLYEALVPTLPEGDPRRQYSLYLGRLYWDHGKKGGAAAPWLKAADSGGDDAVSIEAAFVLTEIALADKRTSQARAALEKLTQRKLGASDWFVPIHYQLAVLYHQGDRLSDALAQYKLVAAVNSPQALALYPKAIAQSRRQAEELEAYLKVSGGQAGAGIETPGYVRKPPTPGEKER